MAKKKPGKKQVITEQQKLFIKEWLIDHNATKAAIRAGYSPKTAYSQGQRLLKKTGLQEYKVKLLEELGKPAIATVEEILEYYTRVMRREEKESVVVTKKEKQTGWITNKKTGKKERVTVEKDVVEVVEIPAKVSDANKAAEMLGKNYGIWTEKVNMSTEEKVVFIDDFAEENRDEQNN